MVYVLLVVLIFAFSLLLIKDYNAKKIYCFIIGAAMIFVAGFRSFNIGPDTPGYVRGFLNTMPLTWEHFIELLNRKEFLYYTFTSLLRCVTDNYTVYLFIVALFFVAIISKFIYKYSTYPPISFLMFMSMGYYTFSMAGLRQTVAMGFLVIAMDKILDKKYIKAALIILLASCFHISSLIFFVALIIAFIPLSKLFVAVVTLVSVTFYYFRKTIVKTMTDLIWEDTRNYSEGIYGGISTLLLLILVVIAVLILYPETFKSVRKKHNISGRKIEIDSYFAKMLLVSIPFQVLAIYQANAFRVAMLFHLPMIVLLVNVINNFKSTTLRIVSKTALGILLTYQLFAITIHAKSFYPFEFFWQNTII